MKTKKPSLRKAINAFCKECIYDQHGGTGTWRQQVEACTSYKCPLWDVRPISDTQPVGEEGADDDRPSPLTFGAESARFRALAELSEGEE